MQRRIAKLFGYNGIFDMYFLALRAKIGSKYEDYF
jgi:hypothetical protein